MTDNFFELENSTVTLREDGIFEHRFRQDKEFELTMDELIAASEAMHILSNGAERAILCITGKQSIIEEGLWSEEIEYDGFAKAVAVVYSKLPQRLFTYDFMNRQDYPFPVQHFKNEEKAIEWLHQQKSSLSI